MKRDAHRLLLAVMLLALAALPAPSATPTEPTGATAPLTNEDIVRMTSQGTPAATIIQTIEQARTVAFDLDPDIVVELRRAGVDDTVIEAMRRVQPRAPAPPATATPAAEGRLELVFEPAESDDDTGRTAVLLAKDRSGKDTTAAFYVYCVDPTHVPDQWQSRTPLASGFPRHRLLWFHEATVPSKKRRGREFRALELPPSVGIEVPEGIHSLELGVAARSGLSPWISLASTTATLKITRTAGSRVVLKVRTNHAGREEGGEESPYSCDILRIESIEPGP